MKDLKILFKLVKIKPKKIELYEMAFTHKSFNGDAKTKHHDYERLEFLGDSVLGCIVSELAFKTHADMDQGQLTKLKSSLVNTHSLADFARSLKFDEYIRVGNSFTRVIKESDNLLEDVFEAFIGAMFLDQGFRNVRKFLISTLYSDIQRFTVNDVKDYKSQLQEAMQVNHRETVTYEVIKISGPAHNRNFVCRVLFDGLEIGRGEGHSKKEAEQNAAKEALDKKVEIK